MFQVYNASKIDINLDWLSGEYIEAKSLDRADVIILDNALNGVEINERVKAVIFASNPGKEVLDNLSSLGIIAFENANLNLKGANSLFDYLETGNLKNSLNFEALDLKEIHEGRFRLSFFLSDVLDPVTNVMEIIAGSGIFVNKISSVRRDDGISYVLLEVTNLKEEKFIPQGELGANVISMRKIG